MNDAEHEDDFTAVDAVMSRFGDAVDRAVAADLDVEQWLARIKATIDPATRSPAGEGYEEHRDAVQEAYPADADLARILAAWSADLVSAGRALPPGGTGLAIDRIVTPIDDLAFFASVVGRERHGLEPWPELEVALDAQTRTISLTTCLPALGATGVHVLATIATGSSRQTTELVPASHRSVVEVGDDLIDLSAVVTIPDSQETMSWSEITVKLTVVEVGVSR